MNIGVIGVYFSNQILNNYMIQVVSDVGGDSEDMGKDPLPDGLPGNTGHVLLRQPA